MGTGTALVLALVSTGCEDILQVESPVRIEADELLRPERADLLVRSVATDFECAFTDYIVATGLAGNELASATQFFFHNVMDSRTFDPSTAAYASFSCRSDLGIYQPLSTARFQGKRTLAALQEWRDNQVSDRHEKIATVAAYAAYAQLLLGESMCSAAFDVGPELTPAEIFEYATDDFGTALDAARTAGSATLESWARVGRARALARLGRLDEAAQDAASVPEGFEFTARYDEDPTDRRNEVWDQTAFTRLLTVDPTYRDLTWDGVADPRVAVTNTGGAGGDGITELWIPEAAPTASTPIPIATWEEARLIVAQAELDAGNLPGVVSIINDLHERAGIPATFESSDPDEVREQLIMERQRELFLQSHHFGDIRQFDLPLSPTPGATHKSGAVVEGQTCFPLPDIERTNNPNIN